MINSKACLPILLTLIMLVITVTTQITEDWIEVKNVRDYLKKIDIDLWNTTLEIKAKPMAVLGSHEKVDLDFFNAKGQGAGGLTLFYGEKMRYHLDYCMKHDVYPSFDVDTSRVGEDKVWGIRVFAGNVRVSYNGVRVLTATVSNALCDNKQISEREWNRRWGSHPTTVQFKRGPHGDTASKFYRPSKHCNGEDPAWKDKKMAPSKYPSIVPLMAGDTVELKCQAGYELFGDSRVTCQHHKTFSFTEEPTCNPCPAGTYRNSNMDKCGPCKGNTYSSTGSSFCTKCSAVKPSKACCRTRIPGDEDVEDKEPERLTPKGPGDWIEVEDVRKYSSFIDVVHMRSRGIRIKSHAEPHSDKVISLQFYNYEKRSAGGFEIKYGKKGMEYKLVRCGDFTSFPTDVDVGRREENSWMIRVDSGTVLVNCNDKNVLDLDVAAGESCNYTNGNWRTYWLKRKPTKIQFGRFRDTASNSYRPAGHCYGLDARWENVEPFPVVPVPTGEAVAVRCVPGYEHGGDRNVTCKYHTTFSFTNEPSCNPCPAGTYRNSNMDKCETCKGNTYSSKGSSFCTKCPQGTAANAERSCYVDGPYWKNPISKIPKSRDGIVEGMRFFDFKEYLKLTTVDIFKELRPSPVHSKEVSLKENSPKDDEKYKDSNFKPNDDVLIEVVDRVDKRSMESVINATKKTRRSADHAVVGVESASGNLGETP